jgi:phage gp45-like
MATPSTKDIVLIGLDILNTALGKATNLIKAQLGDSVKQVGAADDAEWWQHVGFVSRPSVASPGKTSAQCVVFPRGDHWAVIASRDDRCASIYGQIGDGETAIFSSTGKGMVLLKADGSIVATAGAGGASVTMGADGTVKIGGASPVALARGDALQQLISIMTTFCGGNATSLGAPLSTSANAILALQALTTIQTKDTTAS